MAAVNTAPATTIAGTSAHRPVRDLRTFWRRTLALVVPVPMVALAAEMAVAPFPLGGNLSATIAGDAADPGAAQASLWLSMIFGLAVVPATMAVLWTARRGAPKLTLAAGVFLLLGFSAAVPDSDLAAVVAAQQGLDPALVQALDDAVWSPSGRRHLDVAVPARSGRRSHPARHRAVAGPRRAGLARASCWPSPGPHTCSCRAATPAPRPRGP